MLVVGVDPSLTSTGIARSDGELTTVNSAPAGYGLLARRDRLNGIVHRVSVIVGGADLVVIEGPSFGNRDAHAHDRSGLWWLLVEELTCRDIPVAVASPSDRMRYATGKGMAKKDVVLAETVRRYPAWDVNGNDVADALVLCALGCDQLGQPIADVPVTHRKALAKVAWPAPFDTPTF